MENDLLYELKSQLNIPNKFSALSLADTVFSVCGKTGLVSLWDSLDGEPVSKQHMFKRMEQVVDAYFAIYPALNRYLNSYKSLVFQDIYNIYLENGYFYHSPYKISPCILSFAGYKGCVLYRGFSPERNFSMSGLGYYDMAAGVQTSKTVCEMFNLSEQTILDYLNECLQEGRWENIEWPDNVEFLRILPPFSRGYWKNTPDKSEQVSLARYGKPNYIYVFYRYKNGQFQQKVIPIWRLIDYRCNKLTSFGVYRKLAGGILKEHDTLPKIKVKMMNELIEINLGYRLPPAEESFYKLYSWPCNYDDESMKRAIFNRRMSKNVYPIFKHQLENMGYSFEEE